MADPAAAGLEFRGYTMSRVVVSNQVMAGSEAELTRQEARARHHLDGMHDVVVQHTYGWANDVALGELRRLARETQDATPGAAVVHEKLAAALAWAEILYSARKHEKWGPDGATLVRGLLFNAIGGARLALGSYIRAMHRFGQPDEPGELRAPER